MLVEINMPSTLEEAKEPMPKTKERTINIQSQMRDLDSGQLALSCFQDAESSKQGEVTRQGVLRMLAGSKEIVKDMKSLLTGLQCLVSSCKFQGHMHHHLYRWTMELMINITCPQLKKKCLLLELTFASQIYHFLYISYRLKYIFFLGQNKLPGTFLIIFNTMFMRKICPS